MSIIYDALQKTQRNREYIRIQTALTQKKSHRRNLKWMVLGGLILIIGGGVGAIVTFYGLPSKLVNKAQPVARSFAREPVISNHFWVTDSKKVTVVPASDSTPVSEPSLALASDSDPDPILAQLPKAAAVTQVNPAPVVNEVRATPVLTQAPVMPVINEVVTTPVATQPPVSSPTVASVQSLPVKPVVLQETNSLPSNSKLILNGVLISGEEKMALINNQVFHLGDLVEGMKIVSIEMNNVKLQAGKQIVELRVSV